jgi:hypothetical protein
LTSSSTSSRDLQLIHELPGSMLEPISDELSVAGLLAPILEPESTTLVESTRISISIRAQSDRRSEHERVWRESASYPHARPSSGVTNPEIICMIRKRLDFCLGNHRGEPVDCHRRELNGIFKGDEEILLIDVRRLCLFKGLTSFRYVALSYVWGKSGQFATESSTVDALLRPGSLILSWHNLPKVVQDAISLIGQLGEQYLWVDALCIVKDDAASKHHQLELMAQIYNCAVATFIACSGNDASCPLITADAVEITTLNHTPYGPSRPLSYDRANIYWDIAKTYHYRRGWTFQERLLSRRRIYFLGDMIIFHCRKDVYHHIEDPCKCEEFYVIDDVDLRVEPERHPKALVRRPD